MNIFLVHRIPICNKVLGLLIAFHGSTDCPVVRKDVMGSSRRLVSKVRNAD